jgi:hypothetical protein
MREVPDASEVAATELYEERIRDQSAKDERARIREVVARLQGHATCPIVRKTCQAILDRLRESQ